MISTEIWASSTVFYNRLAGLCPADLAPESLATLFASIKEACQTHAGITEGTLFRDQGWYFYQIGRYIERADQTTRLLDIKYHLLLPIIQDVGSPIDFNNGTRCCARRPVIMHTGACMQRAHRPARVAGFLLLNTAFPRSVHHCVREVGRLLGEVKSRYALREATSPLRSSTGWGRSTSPRFCRRGCTSFSIQSSDS